jgi:branched-chain amino acid transport system permease protein
LTTFLALTVAGIVAGSIYALTASGLVVTYTTSGVFNFAQGATGMLAAFTYWTLVVAWRWPSAIALVLLLVIVAPAVGVLIEKLVIRPLRGSGVDATLQATVGILLLFVGVAAIAWNPAFARSTPEFFPNRQVTLFHVVLSWHEIIIVIVTVLVAGSLRVFLYHTRTGTAMRAVVDDPQLLALSGAAPARFASLGWAIGSSLGALAGILLAPLSSSLDINTLTFLIVNGYAAAMVGRLRNLPLTFAGGIGLGLLENYFVGYLPVGAILNDVVPVTPMIFLLVVLLVLPQTRLRTSTLTTFRTKAIPGLRASLIAGGTLIALTLAVSPFLTGTVLFTAGHGVAVAIIMLSLVLLAGFGGQTSLCQLTLAGIGAVVSSKIDGGGSWLGVLAAVGVAAGIGAIISLPALRLRGLYLALATLAFAQGMDESFFNNVSVFGSGGGISMGRPHIPGLPDQSDQGFLVVLVVCFAVLGIGILAVRRSAFGRRLTAMSDSEAGSAMLGISLTRAKLGVFVGASGLAGLGGALYGSQQSTISAADFALLGSLVLLLLATVWGLRTITGMLFAGLSFAMFPLLQQHLPWLQDVSYLGTGAAAIGLAHNPVGAFGGRSPLEDWRARRTGRAVGTRGSREPLAEVAPKRTVAAAGEEKRRA